MIRRISLLRNLGQFSSVDAGADIELGKLALIYAENGRGKTTLCAVMRSLATGDPTPVVERRRLAAAYLPHVVFDLGEASKAVFENGSWSQQVGGVALFDDVFVEQNVCSGLVVDSDHRKNLHELVLGAVGVKLSQRLQQAAVRIEEHNKALREKASAIPIEKLKGFDVDAFCDLPQLSGVDIDAEVDAAEKALAAARGKQELGAAELLPAPALPTVDAEALSAVLEASLANLEAAAEARVRTHAAKLGSGGEEWLEQGMRLAAETESERCPFCAQDLSGSSVIEHYQAYFSTAYRELKGTVEQMLVTVRGAHDGDAQARFERSVAALRDGVRFWAQFCNQPEVVVDTEAVALAWSGMRDAVLRRLEAKLAAPLESHPLDDATLQLLAKYEECRQEVEALGEAVRQANDLIVKVKAQAAQSEVQAAEGRLRELCATRNRHSPEVEQLCDVYLAEKRAKAATEAERDGVRSRLDEYRQEAFPALQDAINNYLERFNAGFRLQRVASTNTRGGSSCTYDIVINGTPVPVGPAPAEGKPSFRNTLSSGDRKTLALAFFFASLDRNPGLEDLVVVIDDPISSLDRHRATATVDEIRRLVPRAAQVIVLSHDKPFLCRLWLGAGKAASAVEIVRDADGSNLRGWDVSEEASTEHDWRDARLRAYVSDGTGELREIAGALRDHLEGYLRVACPEHFPPRTQLRTFLNLCHQRLGRPDEVLSTARVQELQELTEFANRYSHHTNPSWESEEINDLELRQFAARTLAFTRLQS